MFKKFKALVENQTGRKIKKLRTDNGLVFIESEFEEFCTINGIARPKTLVGKPSKMGLQNESTGLYWRKLDVCFQMLGFRIAKFFRQRLFLQLVTW